MAKLTLFSAVEAGWTREDWDMAREELAAVLEYDQCNPRKRAEELALAQTFTKYGVRPKS